MNYRIIAIFSLFVTVPAVSQTVKDIHGDVMPATNSSSDKDGWQVMRLLVPGQNVDNMLYFSQDGILRVEFTKSHKGVDGRWTRRPSQLCLDLPVRGTECFDYRTLRNGETAPVTSDRGWSGTVTMMSDPTGTSLGQIG